MKRQLIIAAPEVITDSKMLTAYQSYVNNSSATLDDLYTFLTSASSDRDEFLMTCCKSTISSTENHLTKKYESNS